jgi:hypothetical protein
MYVYKQTERNPALYTVGFYTPAGKWEAESDHSTRDEAVERVHYLNGGQGIDDQVKRIFQFFAHRLALQSYWIAVLNGEITGEKREAQAAEQEWYQDKLDELLK